MRYLTTGFSLLAILFLVAEPSFAGGNGVPRRRVGGGTRWTQPKLDHSPSAHSKLSAIAFASKTNLPIALTLKAIYG